MGYRGADIMCRCRSFIGARILRIRTYARWGKRDAFSRRRNVRIRYGDILPGGSRGVADSRRRNVYITYGCYSFIRGRRLRRRIYRRLGKTAVASRRRIVLLVYGDILPMGSRSAATSRRRNFY